jgi:hypothetical protein
MCARFEPVRPLVTIYWARLALSIVAAAIGAIVDLYQDVSDFGSFTTGVAIALLIYLLSYYGLKAKFMNKVEKQSKIVSQGIFMYFMAWAVFFILFYSILKGPVLAA